MRAAFKNRAGRHVDLRPDGTVVFRPGGPGEMRRDGSLAMKWPWMRNGVVGRVEVTGLRLDGEAFRHTWSSPTAGVSMASFEPSALVFPSAGCWEVAELLVSAASAWTCSPWT
jgi:hypothetical protein